MVKLAGYETVDTFTPVPLYAGEADVVTTQGTVDAGSAAMAAFTVVALVAGYLTPWDKDAADVAVVGGATSQTTINPAKIPYGVLPHAIDASESAADLDTPVIIGGVLNFEALVADSATYAVLKAAFAAGNSNIVIQKLY